ncbi:hypothetical protein [Sphingomonas profundi]|uniref:hypothetical protein n=1 Tax=Alterirhizorhabdus profundi TaxID=2681549 RepID=UPI0012E80713|nr:hypothetical protein [Sphingomonas profundi]
MAGPLLTIVFAAASLGSGADRAQTEYMRCLSTEVEVAVTRQVDSASFADGAQRVCQEETATYRRMAVASMIGQGVAGASPAVANQKFDQFDRDNRAEMIASFENRQRLRRGPSRVAGLHGTQQQD